MTKSRILLVALGGLMAAGHAFGGTVIFDQSTTINGNGFDMSGTRIADDFSLGSSSMIQGINFEYIFAGGGSPSDLSAISFAIYSDNGGSPGSLISEQDDLAVSGSADGTVCPNCALASVAITSISAGPGTYWLELHAGSSLDDGSNSGTSFAIDWAAVDDNATLVAQYAGLGTVPNTPVDVGGYDDYAFQLTGQTVTATPEPGTAASLLLGLLWIARRRLTKSHGQ